MNSVKQVFLLLCNSTSDSLIRNYKELYGQVKSIGDCVILYHLKFNKLHNEFKDLNISTFSDNIITQLNYFPIGFNLVPGNNHFPLLDFYLKNPNYEYYWCIEEDVRFNGNWLNLFLECNLLDHDFLSSHIRLSLEEPSWYWWHSLAHPYTVVPFEKRLRSFNPIYRISNSALKYIHKSLLNNWCGHHEVLFATLLSQEGFKIADFGGTGNYVPTGFENKYYIDSSPNKYGSLVDGTMRWRPVFSKIGNIADKLYHPVKE